MLTNMTSNTTRRVTRRDYDYSEDKIRVPIHDTTHVVFTILDGDLIEIDESQSWFWTEKWQAGEKAVQADVDAGKVHRFSNVEDAIAALGLEEDAGD